MLHEYSCPICTVQCLLGAEDIGQNVDPLLEFPEVHLPNQGKEGLELIPI